LKIRYTKQFKKDYKRVKKQKKDLVRIKTVIKLLAAGQTLDPSYLDHPLTGNWNNHRDCHIEPDWILIYRKTESEIILERTGSHSELFKK
jgi:mRNA interferase YafQ